MTEGKTRRNFLITSIAVTGGIVATNAFGQNTTNTATLPATMPERVLGRTEVNLPIFGLGAGQFPLSGGEGKEGDATAIVQRALELGIRYFDTAASYGPSEDYLGKVLPPHRSKLFLASKTDQRDRDSAWRELERSLKRLNTDYLDLWQLHHVSFSEELDTIFSPSGAIKALEEAIQQKLVRFAGITGHHDPQVIAEGLRRYPFHTTLIPVNAADKHHPRPFIPVVLPVAQEKNVGVIAMKVPAYGRLFKSGGLTGMEEALGYTLSQPGVHCCVIAAQTVAQLENNVKIAQAFVPLKEQELTAIALAAANVWEDSTFFRAWT
ncbi:aldo/keto reductase [Nostoc sp. 'Lobaria pulmonaria (5183) cyanobiont']|uniref:aldo/keto reductase n=1 Tax=Nostoc sp. 'Lobaria pulmonaria (5183) cyanobiont' TaxID=1618022 RepID=UPI000CF323EB|nr:aldo/keto reductase [Nostoc sp. 'Lobaria pulmonaria (5183) cyanobiont']AVH71060.1 aldo/keto reductase [Nostoc sp. 'Lobaria pulmonaria (5183) cyanobiont']